MSHFWNCISAQIEAYSSNIFEKLGTWIYDRPLLFIVSGFSLSILMGLGLINATFSNDMIELYTPQETTSQYPDNIYNEYMTSKELFGSSLASTLMLILSVKEESNTNIFSSSGLNEAYSIWNKIHSINAPFTHINYTYNDLCEKQYPSSNICLSQSNNFFSIAFTNTTTNQIDPRLWQDTNDINEAIDNGPDKLRLFIGGNGHSLLLSYSLTAYDENSDAGKDIFIQNWISYWSQHRNDYSQFNVYYFSPTSLATETQRMLHNNIKLLILSIFLLLAYMMIIYGKLSMVYARCWLAFGGILSISVSIVAGFGTASAAGYSVTAYICLLPFIVFGVGIDIMVFTVDTFNNIPLGDNDKQRFGALLSEIGYLITISTLTTILAFSFGCVVEISGVRTFCVFALCCFLWNYINFWLIILPIMIWDNKRIANNRNGILCCIESNTSSKEEKRLPYIALFLKVIILKLFINKRLGRYFVMIIFLLLFILSSLSIRATNTTSNPTTFVPSDSYLIDFYQVYNNDFNGLAIAELDIIVENVDFSTAEMRDTFNDLFVDIDNISSTQAIEPYHQISNVNEWLSDFELFLIDNDLLLADGDSAAFYLALQQWTNSTQSQWQKEIIYDNPAEPRKVKGTRFFVQIFEPGDGKKQFEIRQEYVDILGMYDYGEGGSAFIFNLNWTLIYFDFVVLSYTEAIMIFSAIGMLFILWVFVDWRIMFVMMINVIMMNVNLFGWINLCDLILDSMTFIQCLMCIGFTVDYTLYITYIMCRNDWAVNDYLLVIITSLCRSAFTSWIALLPLAFADNSGFVQFYIMFTGIIFIALLQSVLLTTAMCIEINLLFEYIKYIRNDKTDISNLQATIEEANNNKSTGKGQKTPSVELGAIDIDGELPFPVMHRKVSSIDITSCAPIIIEEPQQERKELDTPDAQLGNIVKYTIKIEDVS